MPGSREAADVGVSYPASRFTGRVAVAADRADRRAAPAPIDDAGYSLDVGGSYSLDPQPRCDRRRALQDRSATGSSRCADDRRDSQAVYVGTAFRF